MSTDKKIAFSVLIRRFNSSQENKPILCKKWSEIADTLLNSLNTTIWMGYGSVGFAVIQCVCSAGNNPNYANASESVLPFRTCKKCKQKFHDKPGKFRHCLCCYQEQKIWIIKNVNPRYLQDGWAHRERRLRYSSSRLRSWEHGQAVQRGRNWEHGLKSKEIQRDDLQLASYWEIHQWRHSLWRSNQLEGEWWTLLRWYFNRERNQGRNHCW